MPKEIMNQDEFIKISERASECRVVKLEKEGVAKVKARTSRYLYTIKIPLNELEEFLKKLKCQNIKFIE
ncbi:MAG: 5'-nucleotidase [Desulfurococcaceae archaeon]|jgi:large subunit ribosomal protein L38e